MMKITKLAVTVATALTLVAGPARAQAPDRSAPPPLGPTPTLVLPAVHKRALADGLPVWIVEKHAVPVVQVNLIVGAGAGADPVSRFGLASLTAAMLDEGAAGKDALAVADAVDFLGADLTTASSYDASFVNLHVPVARLAPALAIMADVALRPTFAEADLDRLREERLTSLRQARDVPPAIAAAAFPLLVYGASHRYGIGTAGTEETLGAFTPADLRDFHARYYRPDNATLVVVGDVTPDAVLVELERAFGAWRAVGPKPEPPAVAPPPKPGPRTVYLVDKPGAAQSVIRIGWAGVPRSTPDFFALEVLNTILGGSFTSRLNQNLREEHGYTYGAGSAFDMRLGAGPFFATASVQTDKTAEAITEFFKELEGVRQPVPAAELEKAKNYVARSYPGQFETTRGVAAQLGEAIVYDLPADYFTTYVGRIEAVTADAVERAADTYITPDQFAVVVVGDRAAVMEKIEALKLGPIKVLSVNDVVR
jgi:predicted Zn-dependent peptidase